MKKFLMGVAAAALAVAPAHAASFLLTVGSPIDAVPANNDFQAELNGLGFTHFTSTGAAVALNGPGIVSFEYLAAESFFTDGFRVWDGAAWQINATENGGIGAAAVNNFATPVALGSLTLAKGPLVAQFLTRNLTTASNVHNIGVANFGIFLDSNNYAVGSKIKTSVLYFGLDDRITGFDDNHDDFIVRATISAVPEPAVWGMMIMGFGLVGTAMRRRSNGRSRMASVTA